MEGPTPVSALIHAATMVTAGVYLIARMHPLFEQAPTAADVAAIGGCATLLIAASIAIVQTDIKRVIAYSTMSQLGYMIMGVSVGAYSAALFHHDPRVLQGAAVHGRRLRSSAPWAVSSRWIGWVASREAHAAFTFVCFIVGGLALSGLAPVLGLALEGRHHRLPRSPRRRLRDPRDPRLRWRAADRRLHVPDDLPRLLRRSRARGRRARARPPAPSRCTGFNPGVRRGSRTPTSASPAPPTRSPSARWR